MRTIPPGARVLLDGRELGTSDGLFRIPPGTCGLTLTMNGGQPELRHVEISEGRITRIEVSLQPGAPAAAAPASPTAAETRVIELTAAYKEVALQELLPPLLKNAGLDYTVADDVQMVTSPDCEVGQTTWAIYPVGDLVAPGRSVGKLSRIIETTVAPDSWDTAGGPGALYGLRGVAQALVVSQSCRVHRQIVALLAQLRRP